MSVVGVTQYFSRARLKPDETDSERLQWSHGLAERPHLLWSHFRLVLFRPVLSKQEWCATSETDAGLHSSIGFQPHQRFG
jgi:hypothetical protein